MILSAVLWVLANLDYILIVSSIVIALIAIIAKRTRNTVDDEVVTAAGEMLDVIKSLPRRPSVNIPVPQPSIPTDAPKVVKEVVKEAAKVQDAVDKIGSVISIVDTVAPTVTAPVKQAGAVIGVIGGLLNGVSRIIQK